MSLNLIGTPKKKIIFCTDIMLDLVFTPTELDFGYTIANWEEQILLNVYNPNEVSITVTNIIFPAGYSTDEITPFSIPSFGNVDIIMNFQRTSLGNYDSITNFIFEALGGSSSSTESINNICNVNNRALQFDGVNDYCESTQDWTIESTQAWTFFVKYKGLSFPSSTRSNCFFSNADNTTGRGLSIGKITTINDFMVLLRNTAGTADFVCRFSNPAGLFPTSNGTIQVIYDGSITLAGVRLFTNNVERTIRNTGSEANNLGANSIIGGTQKAKIGQFTSSFSSLITANGKVQEVSLVNYAKSLAELTSDYNNGTQSKGSGGFLFRAKLNEEGTPLTFPSQIENLAKISMNIIGQTSGNFVTF